MNTELPEWYYINIVGEKIKTGFQLHHSEFINDTNDKLDSAYIECLNQKVIDEIIRTKGEGTINHTKSLCLTLDTEEKQTEIFKANLKEDKINNMMLNLVACIVPDMKSFDTIKYNNGMFFTIFNIGDTYNLRLTGSVPNAETVFGSPDSIKNQFKELFTHPQVQSFYMKDNHVKDGMYYKLCEEYEI